MDANQTAFLKAEPGSGNFGDKVRWIKKVDEKDATKLTADIQVKQDDGSWKSVGDYLGHAEDGKLYVRTKVLTFPLYYVIQRTPPPPPPKKKHGLFQPVQNLGGAVAMIGVLGGKGGEGVAKAGGAVSDAGTTGSQVQAKAEKVGDAKDKLGQANGSKPIGNDMLKSGDYMVMTVAPNDVPHNLSTAELRVASK